MATYQELIDDSFLELGVYGISDTPSTADRTKAFTIYKRMIGQWSAEMGPIHFETSETLTLIDAQASYSIGSSGDFNTSRPVQILSAQIRSSNIDYPISIITHQAYQQIHDKTTQGMPEYFSYNPTNTSSRGTLDFYPTPDQAYSLRLTSRKPIAEPSLISDTVTLPPGWEQAIVLNLAYMMATQFGKNRDEFREAALDAKIALIRANESVQEMMPDYLAPGFESSADSINRLTF